MLKTVFFSEKLLALKERAINLQKEKGKQHKQHDNHPKNS